MNSNMGLWFLILRKLLWGLNPRKDATISCLTNRTAWKFIPPDPSDSQNYWSLSRPINPRQPNTKTVCFCLHFFLIFFLGGEETPPKSPQNPRKNWMSWLVWSGLIWHDFWFYTKKLPHLLGLLNCSCDTKPPNGMAQPNRWYDKKRLGGKRKPMINQTAEPHFQWRMA